MFTESKGNLQKSSGSKPVLKRVVVEVPLRDLRSRGAFAAQRAGELRAGSLPSAHAPRSGKVSRLGMFQKTPPLLGTARRTWNPPGVLFGRLGTICRGPLGECFHVSRRECDIPESLPEPAPTRAASKSGLNPHKATVGDPVQNQPVMNLGSTLDTKGLFWSDPVSEENQLHHHGAIYADPRRPDLICSARLRVPFCFTEKSVTQMSDVLKPPCESSIRQELWCLTMF